MNCTIGECLCYARKNRGYTQESLAEHIGVSRGVIFNLEKNKTEPQAIVVNTLCRELKISREWLLEGIGEMELREYDREEERILSELYSIAKELSKDEQLYLLDMVKAFKKRFNPDTKKEEVLVSEAV